MGRKQPLLGDVGEAHALGFLRHSFSDHAKAQSGAAIDWICRGLFDERNSSQLFDFPTLEFHVQVKTARRFDVARSTFREWLLLTETQPVILLVVLEITPSRQEYWYLPLHEWLVTARGQSALTSSEPPVFKLGKDFDRSDDMGLNFHGALTAEANRASRANSSPWATLRDYGLLPFDEALFFEYLELAPHAEIPRGIYHHIASKLSPHHVLRGLLHGDKVADPMVAPWLDRMKELAAQQASTSFQRRQFAQFVRVMKQWKSQTSVPRLPKFRIGETNAWRAFVAMYPHALGMLKFVIEHSQREGDVIFAASMLPVLANSNDRRVEESAKDALQILRGREHDFEGYAFIREFWRSQAESGERDALDRVTDLVTRLETRDSERQFLRRYGWPESALEANLIRKLERPTFRDLNLRQMYDGMANALIRGK